MTQQQLVISALLSTIWMSFSEDDCTKYQKLTTLTVSHTYPERLYNVVSSNKS